LDLSDLNGIFYFIDTSDQSKFEESKEALGKVFKTSKKTLPIQIIGTKIDLKETISKEEIEKYFDFSSMHNSHPFNFILTSIKEDENYKDAFKWISQFI